MEQQAERDNEPGQRQVQEGAGLGTFVRPGGFSTWNRFAAVNDEFIPIHMDDEAGRHAGMPGAFGMGNLTTSWLHTLVREWAGEEGRLTAFSVRFRKPALKGTVACSGTVVEVWGDGPGTSARIELSATDEEGDSLVSAAATVFFAILPTGLPAQAEALA